MPTMPTLPAYPGYPCSLYSYNTIPYHPTQYH
jgi:hypothetical protein